jgi:hypothetical protein
MIYLLCFMASLNVVLLIEQVYWHCRQQESEGKTIGYGRTFLFYLFEVTIIGAIIFGIVRFYNLG